MSQRIDGKSFTLIMPHDLTNRLKRVEKRLDMTRAEAMRQTMNFGLDVYEDFEKLGVVKLAEVFSRVRGMIQEGSGQQKLFK